MKESEHILIVDDHPANVTVLSGLLSREGYGISVACSGRDALDMVREVNPNLILLDILMPEIDGFETCRLLKEEVATAEIPVIFLTAKIAPENLVRGFELGAVDYITKPFHQEELLKRVQTHLALKAAKDKIEAVCREQKEMIQMLCHDLANPMNHLLSVLNSIETHADFRLYQGLLIESAMNGLDIINLVKSMRSLDYDRLELDEIDLEAALVSSMSMLSRKFEAKKLKMVVTNRSKHKIRAELITLVNSVINNVLTNAIKFSYVGTSIELEIEDRSEHVLLRVKDAGIGIPDSILNHIFDFDKSTSRDGTQGEKGNGFGLPLVKKFMIAYGGDISISSGRDDLVGGWTVVELRFIRSDSNDDKPL